MAIFKTAEVRQRNTPKQRENLSAQDRTVLSRMEGERNTPEELDDTTTQSDRAAEESLSFGGKVSRFFSRGVEFRFHGTVISGKNGYQARGGVVPLFSGVTIDLTPASLRAGINKKEGYQYVEMAEGGKPKVMVSPGGTGFLTEHTVDRMVMKAPPKGEVNQFAAEVTQPVKYSMGKDTTLEGSGLTVYESSAAIHDPVATVGDGSKVKFRSVSIDETGIVGGVAEQPASASELPAAAPEPAASTSEPPAAVATPDSGPQTQNQEDGGNGEAPALEDSSGENKEEDFFENLMNGIFLHEDEDKSIKINATKGTFSFRFSKMFLDSEEEEEDDGEETSDRKKTIRQQLKEQYKKYKEEGQEFLEKMGFAKEALAQLAKTGTLPANPYEEEEEDGISHSFEAEFPIFPGFNFKLAVTPLFSLGVGVGLDLENPDEKLQIQYTADENGNLNSITLPKLKKVFKAALYLQGHLGVKLSMALAAGIGYLFEVSGGIWAQADLTGSVPDAPENTFAKAQTDIVLLKDGAGTMKFGDITASLEGAMDLLGSVGAEITAASLLFDWEKELFNYTFHEWRLGGLSAGIKLENKDQDLFRLGSWKRTESQFTAEAFGMQISRRKDENYGLLITQNEKIDTVVEKTDDRIRYMEALCEKIRGIRTQIGDSSNVGSVGSAAYQALLGELKNSQKALLAEMNGALARSVRIETEIRQYIESDEWKSNNDMAAAGIKKHSDRVKALENWNSRYDTDHADRRDAAAMSYYRNRYGAEGAKRKKKSSDQEEARRQAATKANLIRYEKDRLREYGEKHGTRLLLLNNYIRDNVSDQDAPNPKFLEFYKSLGAREMFSQMGIYGTRQELIQYEQGHQAEVTKKHTDRIQKLEAKKAELGIVDDNKPNADFAKYYHKVMNGKMFYDHLIDHHTDIDALLEYEKKKLMENEKAAGHMGAIDRLKEYQARIADETDEAQKKKLELEALTKYREVLGLKAEEELPFLKNKAETAKAASKQEIFDYEKARLKDYQSGKAKKPGVKKKTYADWAKEKSEPEIRNLLSVDMIMEYERHRMEEISGKKRLSEEKRKIHQAEHTRRISVLMEARERIGALADQKDRKEETEKLKEAYFAGGETKAAKRIFKEFQDGLLTSPELVSQSIRDQADSLSGGHRMRLRQLRKFMGMAELTEEQEDSNIPESTAASTKSDAEVWQYYQKIGGGSGFEKFLRKSAAGKTVSIERMIRYETARAREESRQNFFVRMKKVLFAGEGEARENLGDALMGGHFDRYQMLLSLKEQGKSNEEIIAAYKEMGGGKKFEKSLKSDMYNLVTPGEILKYEQQRVGDIGAKHSRRLELIQGEWADKSDKELMEAYREKALEDGSGWKGRLKQFASRWHLSSDIGFDGAVNPEEVLTPKLIMEYETKRQKELTAGHRARLDALNEAADDNDAWAKYREAGGGKRFGRERRKEISAAQDSLSGQDWGYEELLAYEKDRVRHYEEALEKAKEPLEKLRAAQENLTAQIGKCKALSDELDSAAGIEQALESRDSFQTLVDTAANENVPAQLQEAGAAAAQADQAGEESQSAAAAVQNMLVEEQLDRMMLEESGE